MAIGVGLREGSRKGSLSLMKHEAGVFSPSYAVSASWGSKGQETAISPR